MGNSKIKVLLRSLLVSYLLTGILLLLLAFILYKLRWKESQITIAVNIIYVATCLIGGFFMGKGIRQRRFFWGLFLGLTYFAVLFIVSYALNKGITGDPAQILKVMGICAVGGTVGGMLS